MDVTIVGIEIVTALADTDVILAHKCAKTDCLTHCHMMKLPVRPPRPDTGQGVISRGQCRPQDIVWRIPVAKIAPEKHREHDLWVIANIIRGRGNTSDACIRARTTTPAPQITLGVQDRKPTRRGSVGRSNISRAEEGREIAPATNGQRLTCG